MSLGQVRVVVPPVRAHPLVCWNLCRHSRHATPPVHCRSNARQKGHAQHSLVLAPRHIPIGRFTPFACFVQVLSEPSAKTTLIAAICVSWIWSLSAVTGFIRLAAAPLSKSNPAGQPFRTPGRTSGCCISSA